jgi:HSP20 family protein
MRENDMTVITSWDLFDDLRSAQDDMLRMSRLHGQRQSPYGQTGPYGMFAPLGQLSGTGPVTQAWAPAVDISERADAYLVMVELPGVGIEDVEITFQDGLLTIQGQRLVAESAGEKIHRSERHYGTFRRSITLPAHVLADAIDASVQDGVLKILVPKAEEVHAKRIQVRVGQAKAALPGVAVKNGA